MVMGFHHRERHPFLDIYSGNDGFCFVSYAHNDMQRIVPYVTEMQKRGFRIWLDEGIDPGTEWADYIAKRIDSAKMFIVFLSKTSISRRNVRSEVMYALSQEKPILCLFLENFKLSGGMAMQLSIFQAVHLYRYSSAALAIDRLMGSLPASTRRRIGNPSPSVQKKALHVPAVNRWGTLAAVMTGNVKPIADSSDPVFACLAMGDGYLVEPENGLVYSPMSGTITMVFDTHHAVGIASNDGVEILIHVGIDTVKLRGGPFTAYCSPGQHVSAGDLLLEANLDAIRTAGHSPETVAIVTNTDNYSSVVTVPGYKIAGQECCRVIR